jgi:hypothetical protein
MYVYILIPYRSYIQLFPQSNSQQNLGGGPRQEGAQRGSAGHNGAARIYSFKDL